MAKEVEVRLPSLLELRSASWVRVWASLAGVTSPEFCTYSSLTRIGSGSDGYLSPSGCTMSMGGKPRSTLCASTEHHVCVPSVRGVSTHECPGGNMSSVRVNSTGTARFGQALRPTGPRRRRHARGLREANDLKESFGASRCARELGHQRVERGKTIPGA